MSGQVPQGFLGEPLQRAEFIAVAEESGLITQIGQLEPLPGELVVDAEGKVLAPGFIDTHEHLMLTGSQESAVHLDDAENFSMILERIADRAAKTPKGEWVFGSYLNEQALAEKAMPTRTDLDRAVPDHPVFLMHATIHMCALNSNALEIIKPPLDLSGLDVEGGRPTGVIRDPGILTFVHPAMAGIVSQETRLEYLHTAAGMAITKGITTVHALDGGDLGPGDTPFIWQHRHRLPVHLDALTERPRRRAECRILSVVPARQRPVTLYHQAAGHGAPGERTRRQQPGGDDRERQHPAGRTSGR